MKKPKISGWERIFYNEIEWKEVEGTYGIGGDRATFGSLSKDINMIEKA